MTIGEELLLAWRRDPIRMVVDEFKATPDRWQANALTAFASSDPLKQRIALQACVGPGKSAVLAWCAHNFNLCYATPGDYPNAAVVSITSDNLKNNLWKELAIWRDRSAILTSQFEMTASRIMHREHRDTWFLAARSWSRTADPEAQGRTLSGLHAKYIAYFVDESGDINPAVLRAAEQGLSNCIVGKIMQAGNPTSHEGMLYFAAKTQPHLWFIIPITGDPDDPDRSPRVSLEWAKQQIQTWGRTNPWVMAAILGKFPPTSINALLGPDEVRESMARHLNPEDYEFSEKRLGIDVARFGDDATILWPRQGLACFTPVEMRNANSIEVAARIMVARNRWAFQRGMIDSTGGHAGGIIDQLAQGGIHLHEVNFSGKAYDPRFFNLRSQIHFEAAEWVKKGGRLPNIPQVAREAVAPTYWFEGGRLRVIEKDQLKKVLGCSPDYWDALCCTFALPDMPTTEGEYGLLNRLVRGEMSEVGSGMGGHAVSEFDPFRDE